MRGVVTSRLTLAAVAACALGAPATAAARDDFRDTRAHARVSSAPGLVRAQAGLRHSLGPQGIVERDRVNGTPRVVARLDGFLTGPSSDRPREIALAYVRRHGRAFGLDARDLGQLRLVRRYRDIGGTVHLTWQQSYRGVPAFDNGLRAAVTKDGRLLNLLGPARHGFAVDSVRPRFGAAAALGRALADAGGSLAPLAVTASSSGPRRATTFSGGATAGLVLFGDVGRVRLAWEIDARVSSRAEYRSVVDAVTGRVLWRTNTVRHLARGSVWEYFPSPLVPNGGNVQQFRDFSRWGTSPTALQGVYVHAYTDTNDDDLPDIPDASCPECGEVPPNAAGPTWNYPFVPIASSGGRCSAAIPCSWAAGTAFSWRRNVRQNATQVYYYASKFHDHLLAAPIGFTSAAGNFEGPDAIQAQIDDGADTAPLRGYPDESHVTNANFLTPPDGQAPRMQMYLFAARDTTDPTPDVNGGDEADVVYHEYTHGLSSRLILGPGGQQALNAPQSRAMGEGWSDWYALDYVNTQGYKPDGPAVGDLAMYSFVSGGDPRGSGLRTEPLDCSVGGSAAACPGGARSGPGGYTYGDYGGICSCRVEPHADGEIWGQTLWQLRQRLGSAKAETLITRGMELTPGEPSFLDARNGIVQADVVNYGGADLPVIWQVFAERGLGFYASTMDSEDRYPVQNFGLPPAAGAVGAIRGVVRDSVTKRPIRGARVYVGGHPKLGASTSASGRFAIAGVPVGTYPQLIVFRASFDRRAVRITVPQGAVTRNLTLTRNWSALASGARVLRASGPNLTRFGCGARAALDQRQGTGWLSAAASDAQYPGPKRMVVRLRKAITLTGFVLTAGAPCVGDDAGALGLFKLEVSSNGKVYRRAAQGRLRRLDIPTRVGARRVRGVRFVRLTMLGSQGRSDFIGLEELVVHGR
ncbi:MAG: M36 family metallopeptidase [Actinomycetota bacterium]|nr:M36 family metallopeptidase [Actinomycetota bacterium]